MDVLGIDVGGSGIKGAIVDTDNGEMKTERYKILTPEHSTPENVGLVIREIKNHFGWSGPIGMGFPAVIKNDVPQTAANIDKTWIGFDAGTYLSELLGSPVKLVNDADAAGIAELKFGAGKSFNGLVFLLTIGTGIGTAILHNGQLIPNTELGHIFLKNGKEAEGYSSDAVRKSEDLSWEEWGKRLNRTLTYIEDLFWPDLFIIGGGVSRKLEKFEEQLTIRTPLVPAELRNQAGLIGSACYYAEQMT